MINKIDLIYFFIAFNSYRRIINWHIVLLSLILVIFLHCIYELRRFSLTLIGLIYFLVVLFRWLGLRLPQTLIAYLFICWRLTCSWFHSKNTSLRVVECKRLLFNFFKVFNIVSRIEFDQIRLILSDLFRSFSHWLSIYILNVLQFWYFLSFKHSNFVFLH